ncbi:Dabb family protein [Niabella hibiscisoli]|uniref:Dabb family protein n=1 Tax=Niabella hibiscisoli TaxID=1825928 RepID=UPI001F0E7C72|nr:Dabb family protein [Niabella hibiscisoli]MCH5719837.1 Dabb family protein [Niabella hibiscisoli]
MSELNPTSRRKFIKNATVIAAAPSLLNMEPLKKSTIVHHVFFWLKEPGEANVKELTKGLQALKAIPQIKKLLVGVPASTEKRDVVDNSFHVSELMYFDNVKDQDDYQVHPLHKAFVDQYSHLWERVVVYDMIAEGISL